VTSVVLDASAILAFLLQEPGGDAVVPMLADGVMSAVCYSEVIVKLMDRGASLEEAMNCILPFQLGIAAFDDELAAVAASLRPISRSIGLSFADRACLALGLSLGCPVMTADRNWSKLKINVKIMQIR
jgi:PIN domain nuclease of toxin-antitoxin system